MTPFYPRNNGTPEHLPIYSNRIIRFTQQIDLPPGQIFVRVGVLDRTTDKIGTLELPLKVGRK